jgi:hypothetical protein
MPQDAAVPHFFTRYVKQAGALRRTYRRPLARYLGGMTSMSNSGSV